MEVTEEKIKETAQQLSAMWDKGLNFMDLARHTIKATTPDIRDRALEEAAKCADSSRVWDGFVRERTQIAASIRSLKTTTA